MSSSQAFFETLFTNGHLFSRPSTISRHSILQHVAPEAER